MAVALQTTFLVHFLHLDCLKFECNQLIHTYIHSYIEASKNGGRPTDDYSDAFTSLRKLEICVYSTLAYMEA